MNSTRDSLFYMANLGSEFTRALKSYQEGTNVEESVARARAILQSLTDFPDMAPRRTELDVLASLLDDIHAHSLRILPEHLQSYFIPFALRAMARR